MTQSAHPSAASAPAGAPAVPEDKRRSVASALTRYRVLAYITGVFLLVLCVEMLFKYVILSADQSMPGWTLAIPQIHGAIYVIYLLMTVDLAVKARWTPGVTLLTSLAGCVPFLSFWLEHRRTREVRAKFGLSAGAPAAG